jgi:2-(3-amino-3-carboxypropyl)histidine synthase
MVDEAGGVEKIGADDIKRELKRKAARKALALTHQKYGVLVSVKAGQFHKKEALKLKEALEKKGKTAIIIVGNVFRSEELGNFEVDCFVTTACPRLVDDYEVYGKPIYALEDF